MSFTTHTLGFPRIGIQRELKRSLEAYWSGKITQEDLEETGKQLRQRHWQLQKDAGIDLIPVGDFAWYDHVLTTSLMIGNIPPRHQNLDQTVTLDTLFRIARGKAPTGKSVAASEMSKWFNTNYHYIVPELAADQTFSLCWSQLIDEIKEAQQAEFKVKPVLLGPLTYLWLGKTKGAPFDKLSLLPALLAVYQNILDKLAEFDIDWVQIDEPILSLELPQEWKQAFIHSYQSLNVKATKLLLTTYFGSITHQLDWISDMKVDGIHLDLVSEKQDLKQILRQLPENWLVSLGIINGRNIWRAPLAELYQEIAQIRNLKSSVWLGTSCSLLHSPIDLNHEQELDAEVKSWFAFAKQKCIELSLLKQALIHDSHDFYAQLEAYNLPLKTRETSSRVHNDQVQHAVKALENASVERLIPFQDRYANQQKLLKLPAWPTTTIGSFPQTAEIRSIRQKYKKGELSFAVYSEAIKQEISYAIHEQELIGLDVLVHGEAERNDMVEYFGEQLEGYVFSQNGWVQSYGSRCVKPPIIVGDISRPQPMTVKWTQYAQSLTTKPVKGMLTGPITMLCWSFPREDIAKEVIAFQLALAIKTEVEELESAGIQIIQIDEPALREGLPLRDSQQQTYLDWAVKAFKLCAKDTNQHTQIHTHMCYCDFNDIMPSIIALDADVITLETSRSDMELLSTFEAVVYPNAIGPGVYDIHSPNIPDTNEMIHLLQQAAKQLPTQHLWVNPDCGLKTRGWPETQAALKNMVTAAKILRAQ